MTYLNLQLFASYSSKKYNVADAVKSYGNAVKSDFAYDPTTDAAYQAYAKEYARLGEKARQDTLGAAASMTGGYASSYAVSAAAQAQNDYNRQLTAVIPELQQAAYQKWSDKLNNQLNYTNLLMDADSESWNRYANSRDFAYQKQRDKVADSQWYKEYLLAKKASESSGRSSSGGSGRSGGGSGSRSGGSGSGNGNSGSGNGNTNSSNKSAKEINKTLNSNKHYISKLFLSQGQKSLGAAQIYLKKNGITGTQARDVLRAVGYIVN